MKKLLPLFVALFVGLVIGYTVSYFRPKPPLETKFVQEIRQQIAKSTVEVKEPGDYALLPNAAHTYQTFNNCGPATLSMILSWYEKNVSQKELGDKMRPYQVASGDNDDKTIFSEEFVEWANAYGLEGTTRVNGDISLLKRFTANGIPVAVKTWLHSYDDIGHFRVVRGFDEKAGVIIQDDSFEGPNRRIAYYDFLSLWQPFNYNYIIVHTPEQQGLVDAIIASETDDTTMWTNMLARAKKEESLDGKSVYPLFTQSVASYHLGKYEDSVKAFEKVEDRLPKRMLWYQIEPIQAYQKLGKNDRVFQIIDEILSNGNRAYAELYQIRGEIYVAQNNTAAARREFEQALLYNKNFQLARQSLDNLPK